MENETNETTNSIFLSKSYSYLKEVIQLFIHWSVVFVVTSLTSIPIDKSFSSLCWESSRFRSINNVRTVLPAQVCCLGTYLFGNVLLVYHYYIHLFAKALYYYYDYLKRGNYIWKENIFYEQTESYF